MLTDTHGRNLNYLRLSVTDRCNLRCYYCMPAGGTDYAHRQDLLTWDEMQRLTAVFCALGVSKVRITGGEPFLRAGLMPFLQHISQLPGLQQISVTTNGTLFREHLPELHRLGIHQINLSLDSLDRARFKQITRRDSFDTVYRSVFDLLELGFAVKLNCVVMAGQNTEDIIPFIELTRQHPVAVRFLEEMPFNGSNSISPGSWSHHDIYRHISCHYPELVALENEPNSTSVNYRIPGYAGSFGIIPSFSRTFCGSCNRIRLSATGELRTCLYGGPAADLRTLLRDGATDLELEQAILQAVSTRAKDGFEAEKAQSRVSKKSMSVLGG